MGNPSRRFVLPKPAGVKRNHMSEPHYCKRKLLRGNYLRSVAYLKEVLRTRRGPKDDEALQYRDTRCRCVQIVCKVLWQKGLRLNPGL